MLWSVLWTVSVWSLWPGQAEGGGFFARLANGYKGIRRSPLPVWERKVPWSKSLRLQKISIDPETERVTIGTGIGRWSYRPPWILGLHDFLNAKLKEDFRNGCYRVDQVKEIAEQGRRAGGRDLEIEIPIKFPKVFARVVGQGSRLSVSGRQRIEFGGRSEWTEGLAQTATSRASKFPSLDMKQESRFTIEGTVGEKIHVQVDRDSERLSELENSIKIQYDGDEDEIIQKIEAGNTTLSLPGTRFAGFSAQHKGLFGIRAEGKVGGLDLTAIASQEKGSRAKKSFRGLAEESSNRVPDYRYVRNTYFFLDGRYRDQYQNNRDPNQYSIVQYDPADSVVAIEVYVNDGNPNNDAELRARDAWAFAFEDPDSLDILWNRRESLPAGTYERGYFHPLDPEDYDVFRDLGYMVLRTPLYDTYALAVRFETAAGEQFGDDNIGLETMKLKLIKARNPKPSYPTWTYEWKNVYFLGTRGINPEGFDLKILKEVPSGQPLETQGGTSYLQIFHLDQHDEAGNPGPDGIVDLEYIDFGRGELRFPDLEPFKLPALEEKVPQIYDSNVDKDKQDASTYFIQSSFQNKQTKLRMGVFNILEGTETVTLNGRRLTRGQDYTINYFTGELTFLGDTSREVSDPNARLDVEFEHEQMFSFQQKALLGLRGEYTFWEHSSWGTSLLFSSEQAPERRARVGKEPKRTTLWDMDLNMKFKPQILTRAVSALPWIDTDAPSRLDLSAEIARSFPNPNTRGDAFIDDFEGSRSEVSLGTFRGIWTRASSPLQLGAGADRGRLIWYNPWERYEETMIWREPRQTGLGPQQVTTLTLHLASHGDPDVWDGVMRSLPGGGNDFSRSKFIEIRAATSGTGVLHIDLGALSEDAWTIGTTIEDRSSRRNLNTEDRLGNNNLRDGILQPEEDVGLDGLKSLNNSSDELDFWLQEAGLTASEIQELSVDEKKARFQDLYPDRDPNDPSGDDWHYNDSVADRNTYTYINGTEGNQRDPDRQNRPDTEDINNNGFLDLRDDYYAYTVPLDSDEFVVPGTAYTCSGCTKEWRTYRIPLWSGAYQRVGNPDSTLIEYARLWIDGVTTDDVEVEIASIEIVGNRWLERGIRSTDGSVVGGQGTFDVTTKNTQDNSDYESPPGIIWERSSTGLGGTERRREQSLVLKFDRLGPQHQGIAYQTFPQGVDYTEYNALKMWVRGHGTLDDSVALGDSVTTFLRFGPDTTNYYEYRLRAPVGGWEEMRVSLATLTQLKNDLLLARADSLTTASDTTRNGMRVVGNPSMSNIKVLILGVLNDGPTPISGEVWFDELRLSDVRRSPGTAFRASLGMGLADLLDVSAEHTQKSSEFRTLNAKGIGGTETSTQFRGRLNVDRFLPRSWGVSLGADFSYRETQQLPRLKPGSDIVLTREQQKAEQTLQRGRTARVSFSKRGSSSSHWWTALTLDRIRWDVSYARDWGRSPRQPFNERLSTNGSFNYDLSPRTKRSFKLLGWLPAFIPGSLEKSDFSPLPSKLTYSARVNRNRSVYIAASARDTTRRETFQMTQDFDIDLRPWRSVTFQYSLGTKQDLQNRLDVARFQFGREVDRRQSASISFDPNVGKWLRQRYEYRATYHENRDPRQRGGTGEEQGRDVDNSTTLSARLTFGLPDLLRSLAGSPTQEGLSFGRAFTLLGEKVGAVTGSYSRTKSLVFSGLLRRPSLGYQLGFSDVLDVPRSAEGTRRRRDSRKMSDKVEISSTVGLMARISVKPTYEYTHSLEVNPSRTTETRTTVFPRVNVQWPSIQLPLLNTLVQSSSASLSYERKASERLNPGKDQRRSETRDISWSPSWKAQWKGEVSSTVTVSRKSSRREDFKGDQRQGITETEDSDVSVRMDYRLNPTDQLSLPLLKRLNLKSNVDLSMEVRLGRHYREAQGNVQRDERTWSIVPKASYQFSRKFTGGARMKFMNVEKRAGVRQVRKTREVSFWGEIRLD